MKSLSATVETLADLAETDGRVAALLALSPDRRFVRRRELGLDPRAAFPRNAVVRNVCFWTNRDLTVFALLSPSRWPSATTTSCSSLLRLFPWRVFLQRRPIGTCGVELRMNTG